MTTEQPVLLRNDGAIAHIRFNRPHVLNALNAEFAHALLDTCKKVAADEKNRVVVISGEGRAFMSGGDIGSFKSEAAKSSGFFRELIDVFHGALEILAELPRPVIASLNGPVAGRRLECRADRRSCRGCGRCKVHTCLFASRHQSGRLFFMVAAARRRLAKALEIALLSDMFDAQEALRLGIVNKVVPAASLADETDKLAQRLAEGPTFAYGQIKQLMRQSHLNTLHEQLAKESDALRELLADKGLCRRRFRFRR
jgi:2-(1,2-epoxy-1,2-dihydrophenyl)acetyl-CoA isomerase